MKYRGFDYQRGDRDNKEYRKISPEYAGTGLFSKKEIERDKGAEDGKAGASCKDRRKKQYESKQKTAGKDPAIILEAVSEVEEHGQQCQRGDDQVLQPGGYHDRLPIASDGTGE